MAESTEEEAPLRPRELAGALGPGVVAGAADDDPSGIATYSIAGAQFGFGFLWTACLTWPLMAAVQTMCARVGMVTGRGLIGNLKQRFPRSVLITFVAMLFVANTINVGADLSAMADAAETFSSVNSHLWVIAFGAGIAWATVRFRYGQIAAVLKWLAVVLFTYVIAGIQLKPDWHRVAAAALVPSLPKGREGWATLVAILGTTISPYLFFWQASQEVEEERSAGKLTVAARQGASRRDITKRKFDVGVGTFFSNLVMFFVILTCALTLNAHGETRIGSTREASDALRPIAGNMAAVLYSVGILGVGLLAIPTLTGSAAYALAETFGWKEGLDHRFRDAKAFYAVVIVSTIAGIAMDFLDLQPVRTLYWSAVLNGLLAPFLLAGVLVIARDRRLMQGQPSSRLGWWTVLVTTVLMAAAGVLMFLL